MIKGQTFGLLDVDVLVQLAAVAVVGGVCVGCDVEVWKGRNERE